MRFGGIPKGRDLEALRRRFEEAHEQARQAMREGGNRPPNPKFNGPMGLELVSDPNEHEESASMSSATDDDQKDD